MLELNWNLLFTMINLLVLYFLLKKFLINPIQGIMEKRKAMIDGGFQEAKEAKKEAYKVKENYDRELQNLQEIKEDIIKKAKEEANFKAEEILKEAQLSAEKIRLEARASMEKEREKNKEILEKEIGSMALLMAEKLMMEQVSVKTNQDIYHQFLKKAGETNGTSNL